MSTLCISITEQPTEYHRFRYETEVTGGKLGGLLYGRHGNKSCVRLRVTGIDPQLHQTIIVIGGTVNPELYPHPFFMVGDKCSNGAFQLTKDVASLGDRRELDVSLDKVSLVCVSTKGDKLTEAINNRKGIQFNPYNKDMDLVKYNARNLKSVRLVFQVYYQGKDSGPIPTAAVVHSDVINDAKQEAKLGIFGIHPSAVSISGVQEVWVYFDNPLPHTDHTSFTAEIRSEDFAVAFQCTVKSAKKHLLVISKPDLVSGAGVSERLKCELVIRDTKNLVSEQHEIILCTSSSLQIFQAEPSAGKRKRAAHQFNAEPSNVMNDLEELMQW